MPPIPKRRKQKQKSDRELLKEAARKLATLTTELHTASCRLNNFSLELEALIFAREEEDDIPF